MLYIQRKVQNRNSLSFPNFRDGYCVVQILLALIATKWNSWLKRFKHQIVENLNLYFGPNGNNFNEDIVQYTNSKMIVLIVHCVNIDFILRISSVLTNDCFQDDCFLSLAVGHSQSTRTLTPLNILWTNSQIHQRPEFLCSVQP